MDIDHELSENDLLKINIFIINMWNGQDDLIELLHENTFRRYDCDDNLRANTIKCHPVVDLLMKKGFKISDILSMYGNNFSEADNLLINFFTILNSYGLSRYTHDRIRSNIIPTTTFLYDTPEQNIGWMSLINRDVMTNGKIITNLIGSDGQNAIFVKRVSSNPLRATLNQIFILHAFILKPWFREMKYHLSHGTRIERYTFFRNFFQHCIDIDIMGSNHDEDLDLRSIVVANKIIQNFIIGQQCDRIVTMDGHGRLIKRIITRLLDFGSTLTDLQESYALFLQNVHIQVCEKDIGNQIWHSNVFPVDVDSEFVTCYLGNIFDDKIIIPVAQCNGILYLNFSGIGNQCEISINIIRQFVAFGQGWRVMISLSTVRNAANISRIMSEILQNSSIGYHLVSTRTDFLTFTSDRL